MNGWPLTVRGTGAAVLAIACSMGATSWCSPSSDAASARGRFQNEPSWAAFSASVSSARSASARARGASVVSCQVVIFVPWWCQPLTAPERPPTILRCMARKKIIAGIMERLVKAKTPAVSEACSVE